MRQRITKALVDTLKPGALVWDTEVARFAIRRRAEARIYLVKYRHHGRQRWLRIGEHGSPWNPERARREALRLLGRVASDHDPAADRIAERTAPTVGDLCDRFLTEHALKLKPTTAAEYRKTIVSIIKPRLGPRRIADVTRADLAKLHHALRATPTHANRVLALCSTLFNLAEAWGLRPDGTNPTRHLEKFRETKRERFLTDEELARLGKVLEAAALDGAVTPFDGADPVPVSPYALAFVQLALLTGARSSELLTLSWESVDLERGRARVARHKTDRRGAKFIELNEPAVAILAALPRLDDNPYVFPSTAREGGHMVRTHDVWDAIRTAARLADLRLHDLRHVHASVGVSAGISLPIVGKLLGHAGPSTTARYAHVAPDPVREASARIGAKLVAAMRGGA